MYTDSEVSWDFQGLREKRSFSEFEIGCYETDPQ